MYDVWELLKAAGAPEALVTWSKRFAQDIDRAFDACDRPEWIIWLAAVGLVPLERIVRAVIDEVEAAADVNAPIGPRTRAAIDTARLSLSRDVDGPECMAAADEAEREAREAETASVRVVSDGVMHVSKATAWLARAAEGLIAGRLRAESQRLLVAREKAGMLGTGMQLFVGEEPPLTLVADKVPEDPEQGALVYMVAALAESATEIAASLGAPAGGEVVTSLAAALRDDLSED